MNVLLVAKLALELALGAGFMHLGVIMLRNEKDSLPLFQPLRLPRPITVICGIFALAAGTGLVVGVGVPDAGTIGSELAASVLVVVLVGDVPQYDPGLERIYATVVLLALVTLVGVLHWPHQPLLAWWR